MRVFLLGLFFGMLGLCMSYGLPDAVFAGDYIGSKSCAECHEKEYATFIKYSKKAHSWKGISKMLPKLEADEQQSCYTCHTTGYKQGGFVSYAQTPDFADVGCETCHGPGQKHAESEGDPSLIQRMPTVSSCTRCHNSQRVKDFKYKPLLHSGAH